MKTMRLRFAPSPTGPLHIGGARSALFNYLLAEKEKGTLILRMEDTDLDRSRPEYEQEIIDSLHWLGITWAEGIGVGGPHEPYRQTQRLDVYQRYVHKLLETGHAYYCFCSEDELEEERRALMDKGETPRYLGRCRHLTEEERQAKLARGIRPTVRFRVPEDELVVVDDLVRGTVQFETANMGDFIIVKSDGIPTYNFAVVIDDHEMEVTHVIRAEEHLPNTPRQILIYKALGLKPPQFAHISLILGKDRQKMSKRHGATSVMQYREQGYLPEALFNFLALLGWSPEGEEQLLSRDQIIQQFSLDRVARNPAVFDLDKLNWINSQYIKQKDAEELGELIKPFLKDSPYYDDIMALDQERYRVMVQEIRERMVCLADAPREVKPFFAPPVYDESAREMFAAPEIKSGLEKVKEALPDRLTFEEAQALVKNLPKNLDLPAKKVYMPLRLALTGSSKGPELPFLITVMGATEARKRIEAALMVE